MLLAGSFTEYPFFLLQEIFHHRRETGLLEVTSAQQSGYFYVKNGEIKDGEVGKFRGAKAVEVVRTLTDASFQFKTLEPTDFARVVWERSFGSSGLVAVTPSIHREVFRTRLARVLSYAEEAHAILEQAVELLVQGAARKVRLYATVTSSSLKKVSGATGRQTLAAATTAYGLLKKAQIKRKLLLALQKAISGWQVAQRRTKELNLKYSNLLSFRSLAPIRKSGITLPSLPIRTSGTTLPSLPIHKNEARLPLLPIRPSGTTLPSPPIRKSEARLPTLHGITQTNSFLVFSVITVFVGTVVTASYFFPIMPNQLNTVPGTNENVATKSAPDRRQVSRKRAKRKPRSKNRIPPKEIDTSQAEEQKFLPEMGAVQPPAN